MSDLALFAAIVTTALPFFVLMLSMEQKLTKLVTVVSICPNCPKVK